MEEQENKGARSAQELRSDIEKGVSDVQGIKDSWADALNGGESQSGMATYGQMKELVNRQELAELQNSSKAQDAIASALAIAQQSGGRFPHAVTDYLNRQFGFDGKTIGSVAITRTGLRTSNAIPLEGEGLSLENLDISNHTYMLRRVSKDSLKKRLRRKFANEH